MRNRSPQFHCQIPFAFRLFNHKGHRCADAASFVSDQSSLSVRIPDGRSYKTSTSRRHKAWRNAATKTLNCKVPAMAKAEPYCVGKQPKAAALHEAC